MFNSKSDELKKVKKFTILQRAGVYLEHKRASAVELYANILNGLLFSQKIDIIDHLSFIINIRLGYM